MLIEDSMAMSQPQLQEAVNTKRNSRGRNMNAATKSEDLTPGYYMLNEGRTGRNGIPRYVYLGPEAPETPQSPQTHAREDYFEQR